MPAAASAPPPVSGTAPSWAAAARGAWLWDASGRRHADFGCAGGAVLLGHADPEVERAVASPEAYAAGAATDLLCTRLADGRALWTGDAAAARAAAAELARRATGRAAVVRADDLPTGELLSARLAARDVAALVVVADAPFRLSPPALRTLAAAAGTLLVVDETAAGRRHGPAGAAATRGLRADLVVWGAGLANGRALGAVTGEAALLRHAPAASVADPSALAAAAATLRKAEREDVALHIAVRGAEVQAELERLVASCGLASRLYVGGDPCAVTLDAAGPGARGFERRLAAQLAARGVHAPGVLSLGLAHDDEEVEALLAAFGEALPCLAGTGEARAA